ncbi:MAG: hypothetical protein NVSMB49_16270 [Ktedonobacteraceae bacterium]
MLKKLDTKRKLLFWGCIVLSSVALIASITEFVLLIKPSQSSVAAYSVIALENAHSGTTDWKIPNGLGSTGQIQAYAGTTSVLPGQKITFYVSTQIEGIHYAIDIYRLGWYKGLGGRLMGGQKGLVGRSQGYYYNSTHHLVNCSTCTIDTSTGLVEANWQASYTFNIPNSWTTGVYLAKFINEDGVQTYVPFDVRSSSPSDYVAVTADTTYAAYNEWGGYSLYSSYDKTHGLLRATKVSFDRPYAGAFGSSQVLVYEDNAIRWLESRGYDISYISSVDVHTHSAQLLQHKVYLSLGHDEYWTKEMRDGVEGARDRGVSLAFFEADAAYWQMRFEPDSLGNADRTIVCYKVQTNLHNLSYDPLYGKDNIRVTTLWRDPLLNRPENALVGIMFSSDIQGRLGYPWELSPKATSPFLSGTGLQVGVSYGCDLVGYEWDKVFANGYTPMGLQVLGESPTIDVGKTHDVSNTTYYIASSGAMVFATGSIDWDYALDSYRYDSDPLCTKQDTIVPGIQKLMITVMNALIKHSTILSYAS